MEIQKGDKVKFLNDVGGGTVSRVDGDTAYIIDDTGFEYPVGVSELVKSDEERDKELKGEDTLTGFVHKGIPDEEERRRSKVGDDKPREVTSKPDDLVEVDLHQDVITEDDNLEPHRILRLQMDQFRRNLEKAKRDRVKKVVFIHGVGEGILRNEIRKELEYYPNCSFEDAPFDRYGYGATLVRIWYN